MFCGKQLRDRTCWVANSRAVSTMQAFRSWSSRIDPFRRGDTKVCDTIRESVKNSVILRRRTERDRDRSQNLTQSECMTYSKNDYWQRRQRCEVSKTLLRTAALGWRARRPTQRSRRAAWDVATLRGKTVFIPEIISSRYGSEDCITWRCIIPTFVECKQQIDNYDKVSYLTNELELYVRATLGMFICIFSCFFSPKISFSTLYALYFIMATYRLHTSSRRKLRPEVTIFSQANTYRLQTTIQISRDRNWRLSV